MHGPWEFQWGRIEYLCKTFAAENSISSQLSLSETQNREDDTNAWTLATLH